MSIARYKGNQWRVKVSDGPRRQRHVGIYATKRAAKAAEAEALSPTAELSASMTVGEWHRRWLVLMQQEFARYGTQARRGESTMQVHEERTKPFVKAYGHLRLSEVTVPLAREWSQLHRSQHSALTTMFADARLEGIVLNGENPFAKLRIPRSKGRAGLPHDFLTADKVDLLMSTALECHGPVAGQMVATLFAVAVETGMRRGELFSLEWGDIDLARGMITVSRAWKENLGKVGLPKNGEVADVVLGERSVRALTLLQTMPMHPVLVFTSKTGRPLRGSNLHYLFDPVRQRAGLDDVSMHWFRHYTATGLTEQGLSNFDAAQQLRHKDGGELIRTTYSHRDEDAALQRVQDVLNTGSESAQLTADTLQTRVAIQPTP